MTAPRTDLRNVAIIAHVDHGKTTLVDQMLRQSGLFRDSELAAASASSTPTTWSASAASPSWPRTSPSRWAAPRSTSSTRPATPTSAARSSASCKMADGCLAAGRRRRGAAAADALRAAQGVRSAACGRSSSSTRSTAPTPGPPRCSTPSSTCSSSWTPTTPRSISRPSTPPAGRASPPPTWPCRPTDLQPLFDAILKHVPPPEVDADAPLQMLVVTLDYSDYVGRIAIGRVVAGKIRKGQRVALLKRDGTRIDDTVAQLLRLRPPGPDARPTRSAAGDICAVVGLEGVDIGDTIADFDNAGRPAADHGRRADAGHDLPHQRLAVRRPGRHVRHQPAAARPADARNWNRTSPCACGRARAAATSSTSPAAACCTWASCWRTCAAKGFELSVGKPRVITKEVDGADAGADRVPGRRGAADVGRAGDGAGRQPPGGVRQDGRARRRRRTSSSRSRPAA